MASILIIDDDQAIRKALREILEFEKYQVDEAKDGIEGLKFLEANDYDLALLDIKMPGMDGIEVLKKALPLGKDTQFIMISAHGSIETAVEATKIGAFDFLPKPPDLNRMLISVRNALEKQTLVTETKTLKKKINSRYKIIGESSPIQHIEETIDKVAPTDAKVLITGPNGSGKELVARNIHEKSTRHKAAFIEVNCAAIPSELIESELFGHEKGAFTSANKQHIGKFEQAHGGTLFLDEIGDMSPAAQAKVLRALQEGKISRVGGNKTISVDVRLVAATNKNLKEEIEKGEFREDLYHRLSVIVIKVPSLNERRDDIKLLATKFLKDIAEDYGAAAKELEDAAVKELEKHDWTGNIRELRNVVERLVILSDKKITAKDVKSYI